MAIPWQAFSSENRPASPRFGILSFEGPDEMVGQSKRVLESKEAAH
jgi:hypothetical protein